MQTVKPWKVLRITVTSRIKTLRHTLCLFLIWSVCLPCLIMPKQILEVGLPNEESQKGLQFEDLRAIPFVGSWSQFEAKCARLLWGRVINKSFCKRREYRRRLTTV